MSISKKINLSGDKSISHRALMIASISNGATQISNLCNGKDVQSTIDCLQACGADIAKDRDSYIVSSSSLFNPSKPLDCGNSGTTMRLMAGLLAGQGIVATLYGDSSLMKRPMNRIIEPLKKLGSNIDYIDNQIILKKSSINGGCVLNSTPSAQVKSSIILAALGAKGSTFLTESYNSRDHTERMLSFYSPNCIKATNKDLTVNSYPIEIKSIEIPGDTSKASFLIAYACMTPKSDVIIQNALINPTRMGFINTLKRMGANISINNKKMKYGELVGDIHVQYKSKLKNVYVNAQNVRDMVDEIPILAIVAALSKGVMKIEGVSELKLKESNRVLAIISNLKKMSCDIREKEDSIMIKGRNYLYNTNINTFSDHRIAMAFHVASFFAKHTMVLDDLECIKVSFPDFFEKLEEIKV